MVETYISKDIETSLEESLSQEDFEGFVNTLNQAYKNGEVESDPERFYVTFVIAQKEVKISERA